MAKFHHKLSDNGSQYRALARASLKGKDTTDLKGKWIKGTRVKVGTSRFTDEELRETIGC